MSTEQESTPSCAGNRKNIHGLFPNYAGRQLPQILDQKEDGTDGLHETFVSYCSYQVYLNTLAKGRVERGFGTHQDRLVKEMRLAGIKTGDGANEFLGWYLPKHNRKFSISPAKKANLHRKSPGKKELKKVLCMRTKRSLRKDSVIEHNKKFYQVEDIPRRRIKTVMVEDRLDGSMHIRNNGSYFKYREIDPSLIRKADTTRKIRNRARKVYIPPKDHPWRRYDKVVYKSFMNME